MSRIQRQLLELQQQQRFRERHVVSGSSGSSLSVNGEMLLNFADNDYLGLRTHPQLAQACAQSAHDYGVGSGASALISGYSDQHQGLERELAEFLGYDKALLFSSGYLANQAVLSSLCQAGDGIFSDQLNHASLIDGCRLSRADVYRFEHANTEELSALLNKHVKVNDSQQNFILSDGVFSMDGDCAAYVQLQALARQYSAMLIIDDAHGVGVMGANGRGSWEAVGADKPDLLIGTLGKAFGTQGAYVAASEEIIDWLIQKARSYIYTTALAPPIAAATRASLQLIKEGSKLRQHLAQNIAYFRSGADKIGLQILDSQTPIQAVILGAEQRVIDWSASLKQSGILVGAIRPPTVPEGTCRLRITLSAAHTKNEIDQLLEGLKGPLAHS